MMKKIALLLLAAMLTLSFTACKGDYHPDAKPLEIPTTAPETDPPETELMNGTADLTEEDFVFTAETSGETTEEDADDVTATTLRFGEMILMNVSGVTIMLEDDHIPLRSYSIFMKTGRGIVRGSTLDELAAAYGIDAETMVRCASTEDGITCQPYGEEENLLPNLLFGYTYNADGKWDKLNAEDLTAILSADGTFDGEAVVYLFTIGMTDANVISTISADFTTAAQFRTNIGL